MLAFCRSLAQQEGLEVPPTGMPREGVTTEIGEPSSPSGLSKDLSSSDTQLGKRTKMCHILSFLLLLLTLMLWLQRVPGHQHRGQHSSDFGWWIQCCGVCCCPCCYPVAMKATTITVPEVLATTSASKESAVGLTPVWWEKIPCKISLNQWRITTD